MYKIDDIVMHPGMGVCKIVDIRTENFKNLGNRQFYILKPVYSNEHTKIFVPVSGKVELRRLLSEKDINEAISAARNQDTLWIDNDLKRKEVFSEILHSGDHIKLIGMIREIHKKQIEKQQIGKKLHLSDEKMLTEAEKLLHEELAYSMSIEPTRVADYIISKLNA